MPSRRPSALTARTRTRVRSLAFHFCFCSSRRETDCQTTLTSTAGDFDAISLSNPLNALMNDKFQQLVQIRRSNDRVGWAGAEQHCFTGNGAGQPLDKKAARAADKEEKTAAETNASPVRPLDNARGCRDSDADPPPSVPSFRKTLWPR